MKSVPNFKNLVWFTALPALLWMGACQDNFIISYEKISAPLDVSISSDSGVYRIEFYSENSEANFQGWILNLGDTGQEAREGRSIDIFCECDRDCRRIINEEPTDRREVTVDATATPTVLSCDIGDAQEGRFLAIRSLVSELNINSDLIGVNCVRDYSDSVSDETNAVRCSRSSGAVVIPPLN